MRKKYNILIVFIILLIPIMFISFITTNHKMNNNQIDKILKSDPEITTNEDWYNDWNYSIEDNYIYLNSIKTTVNKTSYTIPSKATIDGIEYTTAINNGSILAGSPIEELKMESGIQITTTDSLFVDSNLKKLDMSNMDLSYLNTLSFINNHQLEEFDISGSNLSGLKTTGIDGYTVFENANLVNFSNANLTNVTNLYLSGNIETIDLSGVSFDSYNVSYGILGYGTFENALFKGTTFSTIENFKSTDFFRGCITNVDFSGAHLPNAKNIKKLFGGSTCIKKIDLSNLDAPVLEKTDELFSGDAKLEEIIFTGFNSNVTGENSKNMFNGCTSLKNLTIEGFESVSLIVTPSLEELTIKNIDVVKGDARNSCGFNGGDYCRLKKVTFENVGKVEKGAFAILPSLDEIEIRGTTPEIEQFAFFVKPTQYQYVWTGYNDGRYLEIFNSSHSAPVLKHTTLIDGGDTPLNYNFKKDERFISDFQEHQITYDNNYDDQEKDIKTFIVGDHVKTEVPTRDEYIFKGWNTEKDGSGKIFAPYEIIYLEEDFTLYAQWKKRVTDSNNSYSGWIGESVRWRYDPATSTAYVYPENEDSDGRIYDQVDEDEIRLTMPEYLCSASNIVFEEGITYIGKNMFRQCTSKKTVTFPSTLEEIGGGAFLINIEEVIGLDFEKVKIQNGVFYSNITYVPVDNGTIYWSEAHPVEHQVIIDANGGEYEDGTTEKEYSISQGYLEYTYIPREHTSKIIKHNAQEIEIPTKEGSVFVSLNTRPDGSGKKVDIDDDNEFILEAPTSIKLYAIYQKNQNTITFATGDVPFEPKEQKIFNGEKLISEYPTKEGYIFAEWNTKEDGSGIGYYPNQTIRLDSDLTLYPIFRKPLVIQSENSYYSSGTTNQFTLEDGTVFRVLSIGSLQDSYGPDDGFYEVSKELLSTMDYYKDVDFEDYVYNELKTMIATYSDYDEAGLFDTFYAPSEFYDFFRDMPIQFIQRTVNPRNKTSNNGSEKYFRALRFSYVFEHSDTIGPKYKLRVFTNGYRVYVGIEPIEPEEPEQPEEPIDEEETEELTNSLKNPETKTSIMILTISTILLLISSIIGLKIYNKYVFLRK